MLVKRKKRLAEFFPRTWRASVRDTSLLLSEFRGPVLFFALTMLGLGTLYYFTAIQLKEPVGSLAESVYLMLTLTFLQPSGNFPTHPFLQSFFFFLPLVGVGTLARGLADFGVLFFNRSARNKEWEMAVASTYSKHTVLVGLGHLGFRVVDKLHELEESVVAIELNPSADLFTAAQSMGIPVIQDDATRNATLEAAGVRYAKTIILCTQNDSINLQVALKARSLNPNIQVVIRIFDEDFARSLHDQFGFTALSATEMAAPVFAAAAAGVDVTNPISVEGQLLSLARLTIVEGSTLAGRTVGFVEDTYHLNIVFVRSDHHTEMHPTDSRPLTSGDILGVLGGPEQLGHLVHDNE
ncbi:MAG TPA: NAD-binding protein [Anaerolineales bacterium]|jgi:Trk K+ transport system NAD-binding subunit